MRLRPTFSFPDGVARRAGSLAGAGVLALVAQQAAVAATLWLTHAPRTVDTGVVNVYTYVQAVYLLPYAVLAVPIATSAFPALAHSTAVEELEQQVGTSARDTLAAALRGILLLTAGAVTVLMAVVAAGRGVLRLVRPGSRRRWGSGPGRPARARCRPTPRAWSGSRSPRC